MTTRKKDLEKTEREATSQKDLEEIKREATTILRSVKATLEGLLLEIKGAQRRQFDTSDFTIHEFRRLSDAVDRLTAQLEKHK